MARYDVYGLGNALVDKEFEVDDAFFEKHNIEKGLMTLVDQEQQQRVLDILNKEYSLKHRSGGGSAANTLYALSQFGGNAYFSCKVANDETGDFFLDQLGHHNIETDTNNERAVGTSGRCLVMISPDAERTMLTFLGVSADVSSTDLDFAAVDESKFIYLEGYLVASPAAKTALIELKQYAEAHGVQTAMTFSDPSMVEYFHANVNEVLGSGVDLLFCNEKEALLWSGETDLTGACAAMRAKAKRFAITRGAKGALLFDGANFIDIDPHPVKAVDTNGAGDMFAGAFLYALTSGRDFATAGKLASLASATVVSSFGPRLDAALHEPLVRKILT